MNEDISRVTQNLSNFLLEAETRRQPAYKEYRGIFSILKEFESKTPNTHLVCAKFVVNSQLIVIQKVNYIIPDILIFAGKCLDGSCVHIVQNVSQLNLALIALPKPENVKIERRKIGFEFQGQEVKPD